MAQSGNHSTKQLLQVAPAALCLLCGSSLLHACAPSASWPEHTHPLYWRACLLAGHDAAAQLPSGQACAAGSSDSGVPGSAGSLGRSRPGVQDVHLGSVLRVATGGAQFRMCSSGCASCGRKWGIGMSAAPARWLLLRARVRACACVRVYTHAHVCVCVCMCACTCAGGCRVGTHTHSRSCPHQSSTHPPCA